MSESGQLVIEHLQHHYWVSHQHPHPEGIKTRLDQLSHKDLTAVLQHTWQPPPDSHQEAVWLLQQVNVQLTLDLSQVDNDTLIKVWSQHLVQTILSQIRQGADGQNRLYFANRAAYVTQFILDLVEGQAWNKWYYNAFDGLRSLMPSQAVREALIREGAATTQTILHHLKQQGHLEKVLRVLHPADAWQIYHTCQTHEARRSAALTPQQLHQVVAVWAQATLPYEGRWATAKNHLRLWLTAARHPSIHPSHNTLTHLLNLADILTQVPDLPTFLQVLDQAQVGDALALARQMTGIRGWESLPVLFEAAPQTGNWWHQMAQQMGITAVRPQPGAAPAPAAAQSSPALDTIQTYNTACGGLFLLLPTWIDLGWHHLFRDHAPDEHQAALWRYGLALKCLGPAARAALEHDPVLLLLTGLETTPNLGELLIPPALYDDFLSILQGQGRMNGRFVAHELITTEPTPLQVWRDMQDDYWLYAGETGTEPPSALTALLAHTEQIWQPGHTPTPALETAVSPYLQKARSAGDTLTYCHLPTLPPPADLTLTLLAQATLRTFARRLMGFAWSTPLYLADNLFQGQSLISIQPEQITAHLPATPLDVVLRLAGFHGQTYTIPWLSDRAVRLTFTTG